MFEGTNRLNDVRRLNRKFDRDDVLAAVGLRRRGSPEAWLTAAAIFAAGGLVGTGIALLVAPKRGRDLREELRGRANELSHRMKRKGRDVRDAIAESEQQLAERVESGARDWRATAK